jgi:two-component system, OmpR family, sensor histidine kinase KdpD
VNNADGRPSPDALLRRLQDDAERARRGRLRIFFGFAPGVGKTWSMLSLAQRLRAQGTEVVVGWIDTHGRADTAALLEGIEALPHRVTSWRGVHVEEFDLDAALRRKPQVLLVDELAHSNAPDSRHPKRWQDVEELLGAGITVHTTLNVQHLESLVDVVAQVTTVRVRETVPDSILDRADEIEVVDIPIEELLARLAEGKVYVPDQAKRAAEFFFRRGNLLALRELALRRTAEHVDAAVQSWRDAHAIRQTWHSSERILVCVGPSPSSAPLVRAARRLAAGLRASWVAATVQAGGLEPTTAASGERLDANLRLAESLGAQLVRLVGPKISTALLEWARDHGVTRIVLGKPTHSRIRDLVRGSLVDEIIRGSGDIEVHMIADAQSQEAALDLEHKEGSSDSRKARAVPPMAISPATGASRPLPWGPAAAWARNHAMAVLLVALASAASKLAGDWFDAPDVVALYLLAIMLVAARYGRWPSLLASGLSVAAYDFLFVPPQYTFAVSDSRHLLTFALMFGVGQFISVLTLRIRRQQIAALEREARTQALYSFSRDLGAAPDPTRVAEVLVSHVRETLRYEVGVVASGPVDALPILAASPGFALEPTERSVLAWVLENGRSAGAGTDTLPGVGLTCVPVAAAGRVHGALAVRAPARGPGSDEEQRHFLALLSTQAGQVLERLRLSEEAEAARLRARTEEVRSSLLGAVSHDLRTPLAVITGASSTLRDPSSHLDAKGRALLLDTLHEESERLERLVVNLLDMTRLEAGNLAVHREWVPLEEMVGSAIQRVEPRLGKRHVRVDLPEDLPLLSVDPVLFEQVFVNLLENAARYTPDTATVDIRATAKDGMAQILVSDDGAGLPPGTEEHVFEKFFRGHPGAGRGSGLGLAICRGIVEAHDGRIDASNQESGGARFRIRLRVPEGAPGLPQERTEDE